MIPEFTDNNFNEEVIGSKTPAIVDFWAVWCGPCKAMTPVIDELGREFEGRVKIGKLNVDENPGVSQKYSIFNIPTLIFFKDGVEAGRLVGVNTKEKISKRIKELL
ncbi:MAG: thioredoxin [Candidatus Omnitrophica bacterium]|nr:thioredoxin [Candidatus Omnitrophota bacterium]